MMFQGAHPLVHRHMPLEDHPARLDQATARHQTSPQVPLIGLGTVDLARVGGSEMLQGTAHLCSPVTTRPQPQQAGRLERRGDTQQVKPLCAGFVDHEPGARSRGRTLGPPPGLATVRRVEALTPGPSRRRMHPSRALPLAASGSITGRSRLALDQPGALQHVGHMRPQLRVTHPTIGHHQRCREVEAAAA
jgi:hypothetical protein